MIKKKKIGLAQCEAVAQGMKARGVEPTPETMVTVLAVAEALNVPVTVEQEAQAEIEAQNAAAASAREAIEQTQAGVAATIEELQNEMARVKADGTVAVRKLSRQEAAAASRAQEVQQLAGLLQSA